MTIMKKLSFEIMEQINQMLPGLREETKKELTNWGDYVPCGEFYSDDEVIRAFPFATYEYVAMAKRMRVDRLTIINWLNKGQFDEDVLKKILAHTLRRLTIKKQ
jgi:hypothetical protein